MIRITCENRNKVELKRYVLFSYCNYYPSGGKLDMEATSDNIHDLKHYAWEDPHYDHHDILDMEERKWYKPRDV